MNTCHLCGKTFVWRGKHRGHMLYHNGKKSHIWPLCWLNWEPPPPNPDATGAGLLELLGADPNRVLEATLHMEAGRGAELHTTQVVLDADGAPIVGDGEVFITSKRYKVTEIGPEDS